ncbi:MAG TPA: biotin--[acetyl-CoA-carboxylase] ligase [Bryobacteraceae bacterium]|nr:biotin--[acetyl-CoA-carboxylase] ligase [Bryobacteraceae bacterium]
MPFDLAWVQARLPARRIDWHSTIGSTMTEASRLAAEGCPSGTVVGADAQSAGQGRYGRSWLSEADAGLYVSVVLRYNFAPGEAPVVTLALGLATVEAILKTTDIACDLRWPNDVLIGPKKCAGILTHMEGSAIVAGIGINVNQPSFPPDLSEIATSLRIVSGRAQSRERLLVDLLVNMDRYCALLEKEGPDPILKLFSRASSYVSGRRVTVDLGSGAVCGTTAGLNESGFLMLRSDDGSEHVIIAGGVRPCS